MIATSYLPNPVHSALTTGDEPFALVPGLASRFPPETIPFAAVPELSVEALTDLRPLLNPGEEIYLTAQEGQESVPSRAWK